MISHLFFLLVADTLLEPKGIVGADLILFPLLFLTGFTLLSAFLGTFAETMRVFLNGKNKGLVESLMDDLASIRQNQQQQHRQHSNKLLRRQPWSLPRQTDTTRITCLEKPKPSLLRRS